MNHAYCGRRNTGWQCNRFATMPCNQTAVPYTPAGNCSQPMPQRKDCEDMVVAMAYVPWQQWGNVYTVEEAYSKGTLFPDLDKPFLAGGGYRCG